MKIASVFSRTVHASVVLAFLVGHVGVQAGKPEWAGHGNGKKGQQEEGEGRSVQQAQPSGGLSLSVNIGFGSQQQRAAQDYYGAQARAGKCPPGLADRKSVV